MILPNEIECLSALNAMAGTTYSRIQMQSWKLFRAKDGITCLPVLRFYAAFGSKCDPLGAACKFCIVVLPESLFVGMGFPGDSGHRMFSGLYDRSQMKGVCP